ncbi:MAG: hypothetical protein SGPRY_007249 [Prymnesium sp.]
MLLCCCRFHFRLCSVNFCMQAVMSPSNPHVEIDVGSFQEAGPAEIKTFPCDFPSPINPSYSYGLKVRLHLPLDDMYLPAINIRVRDNLFGGTIQPVLCSGEIQITRDRLKNYLERVMLHLQSANIRSYYRRLGWSARGLLPSDPPPFSEREGPPWSPLPKANDLPSAEWVWATEWQLDLTINPEDEEGWAYAPDFDLCGAAVSLDYQASRVATHCVC